MSRYARSHHQPRHRGPTDAVVHCPVCHGDGTVSHSDLPCLQCDGTGELTLAEYDSAVPVVRARTGSAPTTPSPNRDQA
jgi:DnaJ-class molecular chaperone